MDPFTSEGNNPDNAESRGFDQPTDLNADVDEVVPRVADLPGS